MKANKRKMTYSILWIRTSSVKTLKEHKIERGLLKEGHTQVFDFNVLEVKNLSFARVDFFIEGRVKVHGSDKLIDFSNMDKSGSEKIYTANDRSLVFHNLTSFSKYYVYFGEANKDMNYKIQLSFGYVDADAHVDAG